MMGAEGKEGMPKMHLKRNKFFFNTVTSQVVKQLLS